MMIALTREKIESLRVIPVVAIEKIEDALPLAQALKQGGLPIMEITFRTDCAVEAMKLISKEFPDILIGAGTVLTTNQCRQAIKAGAKFIVTPGFDEKIVQYCLDENVPIFPGAVTPTEIMKAISMGIDIIKFFPAENYGGLKTIKSLSAPFSNIKFIPTGGVSEANLESYLSFEKTVACGGTWMCPKDLIVEKKFDVIEEMTRNTMNKIKRGKEI